MSLFIKARLYFESTHTEKPADSELVSNGGIWDTDGTATRIFGDISASEGAEGVRPKQQVMRGHVDRERHMI